MEDPVHDSGREISIRQCGNRELSQLGWDKVLLRNLQFVCQISVFGRDLNQFKGSYKLPLG
jgi:hypothetical protein